MKLKKCVPKWISVEERLPEDFKRVLVFDSMIGLHFTHHDTNSGWYPVMNQVFLNHITHWQPLPELPEENNEHEATEA